MNIFFLSTIPEACARMHCDKHVVKMILEYAQLMSTAHHICGSWHDGMYKPTHLNHPCAVWTRQSAGNYIWLFNLWCELLDEYTFRYGKRHKTGMLYDDLSDLPFGLTDLKHSPPPKCMPDDYKRPSVLLSYRNYYKEGKADILQYTRRERPNWLTEVV